MFETTGYLKSWLGEIETKKLKKIGTGMPWDKFNAAQKNKIIKILNNLWGKQFDLVTQQRVLSSLQLGDLPSDFLADLDGTTEAWIRDQFNPTYQKALEYSASGNQQIAGMLDDINRAVGADILFDTNTDRIREFIQEQGGDLAVNLTTQQHGALKEMLQSSIDRNLSIKKTYDEMRRGITLTNQEAKWLNNFRERTYNQQMKYFRETFPDLSEANIIRKANAVTDRRVLKKHNWYQKSRSERIARTELKRAKHEGESEAHRQAKEKGIIKEAYKTWRRGNFTDNWQSSIMFDGKRIAENESFEQFGIPSKTTMKLPYKYPAEINEHCFLEWSVDTQKKPVGTAKPKKSLEYSVEI